MEIMTVSELRKDIYNVVKHVATSNEPVTVLNKVAGEAAILVSMRDWEDIQETLYLTQNTDARETIRQALTEPIEEGVEMDWRSGK